MIYTMYVETAVGENAIGWSFMIYNHQDFNVYKLCGKTEGKPEREVILEVAAKALAYFSNFIRRRYYDEHFATILDEDSIALHTRMPEIEACWKEKRFEKPFTGSEAPLWTALIPYFSRPTMSFVTSSDETFIAKAKDLAKQGLQK